jgi:hypothetical protein
MHNIVNLIMDDLWCKWWHGRFLVTITPGVLHSSSSASPSTWARKGPGTTPLRSCDLPSSMAGMSSLPIEVFSVGPARAGAALARFLSRGAWPSVLATGGLRCGNHGSGGLQARWCSGAGRARTPAVRRRERTLARRCGSAAYRHARRSPSPHPAPTERQPWHGRASVRQPRPRNRLASMWPVQQLVQIQRVAAYR